MAFLTSDFLMRWARHTATGRCQESSVFPGGGMGGSPGPSSNSQLCYLLRMSALLQRLPRALLSLDSFPADAVPKIELRRLLTRAMASGPPSLLPRQFPASGFVTIDINRKIEEEQLPHYVANKYYPVRIGEVFASRYQVVFQARLWDV